ncbi:MAG: nitroreductase family protein [Clostridia bacterium]|nr:nitroreductase family protein [Clostridia bacterium]
MNETVKNILERRSVRSYMSVLPPEDDVMQIVECGRFAATALGRQPWFFSVVYDRALLDDISAECAAAMLKDGFVPPAGGEMPDTFRGAPMAIIVSADDTEKFGDVDCANATQNMAVAAWSMGIGSCYIASFRRAFEGERAQEFKTRLGVPLGFTPRFALSLGYAASPLPPRKERAEDRVEIIK